MQILQLSGQQQSSRVLSWAVLVFHENFWISKNLESKFTHKTEQNNYLLCGILRDFSTISFSSQIDGISHWPDSFLPFEH